MTTAVRGLTLRGVGCCCRNDGIDDIYKRSAVSQKYGGDLFHGLKGRSGAQRGCNPSAVTLVSP